ncbi:MAG: PQQ-binding-like beta-propeller repeat protein [Planctomycetales bacterium]|nr:PQQ-binding-like beta-propeller repeat protein [Planctomycetales bacterium]
MHAVGRLFLALTLATFCASIGRADWRQFRGGASSAIADQLKLPEDWESSQRWKVDLPGRGPSSPIVVDGRVIVTCSSGPKQDRLHVVCFSEDDGQQLWHRQVWATGRTFCHPSSSIAAPTPASDGKRVFAFFSSNDLLSLDLDGNLQWYRGLTYDYPHAGNDVGMSSSPLVVGDRVVVQVENQGDSFAAGLDVETGETRWRIDRDRRASWSSPVLLPAESSSAYAVLLQAPGGLTAIDSRDGKELWSVETECPAIPSATARKDLIVFASGGALALRPNAGGEPERIWQAAKLSIGSASPVLYQDNAYVLNSAGVLKCGSLADGDVLWELRLKGRFWATPIVCSNGLLCVNSDGLLQIVSRGDKPKVDQTYDIGEVIQGTPAVSNGAIFLRSDAHLWKFSSN